MVRLPQFLSKAGVAPKILLASNKEDGQTLAEVHDLRDPLYVLLVSWRQCGVCAAYFLLDVVQRIRRVDCETNEDDMRIWVTERAETIVIFLACCIPQRQLNVLAVYLNIRNVVFEHGRDVNLKKIASL